MIVVATQFEAITCCRAGCGITFAVPEDYRRKRREDHETFYCPNGHPNYFPHKSEAEQLRDQLARVKRDREWTEARLADVRKERDHVTKRLRATQGVVTRTKNRIHNGVCPCCNRSFTDLRRHMETKHPDYAKTEA